MAEPEIERQVAAVAAQDEDRLAQFGYKQELKRDWVCVHTHLCSGHTLEARETD
jgi:hypothetical protein